MEVRHRILLLRNIIYFVSVYNYPIDPIDALKTLNARSLKYENLWPQLADHEIPLFTIYIQDQELYFIPLVGFNC